MTKYLDYSGVSKLWEKTKTHVAAQIKANVTDKKGVANGIASLDANGRVPLAQLGNLDTQVFIVVEKLPTTGIKTDKIYIVKDSATAGDLYQEYYYTNGAWEKLGTHQLQVDWTTLNNHIANTSNPHKVTKEQVGLGNVDNTSDAAKPVSTAQATAIADAKKAGTDAQSNLTAHANNKSNPHGVTKAQVGLGNVDNTSDAAKPVSTAQKAALDLKADKTQLANYLPLSGGTLTGDLTVKQSLEVVYGSGDNENIIIDLDGLNVGDTIYGGGKIQNRNPTGESFTISIPTKDGTFALTDDVKTATANKVDKVAGKGLSTNDYTTAEKNKLAGIPADANHTTVDASLNNTSANPVQNKAVFSALSGKVDNSTYNTDKTTLQGAIDAKLNKTDIVAITDAELDALLV